MYFRPLLVFIGGLWTVMVASSSESEELNIAIISSASASSSSSSASAPESLPLCTQRNYIRGKWILEGKDDSDSAEGKGKEAPTPTLFSFPCCASDWANHQGMSPPDEETCGGVQFPEIHRYHPMYGAQYQGSNDHYAHFPAMSCARQHFEKMDMEKHEGTGTTETTTSERKAVAVDKTYRWKPDNCLLPAFDGKKFCEVLGNRTILMIGDSTMQQTSSTLMSMILASGGTCADQIFQTTTYYMVFNHHGVAAWTKLYDEWSTNFKVSTEAPDICILNYGSWNQDPGDNYNFWEGSNSFKAQLRERKDMDKNKGSKFVWKLLNPPHFQCKEAYEPLPTDPNDDPFDLPARAKLLHTTSWDKFGWNNFWEYDKQSLEFAANESLPVIDMYPLYFRPDSHVGSPSASQTHDPDKYRDCLHYNVPDSLNIFSDILMNMLVTEEI